MSSIINATTTNGLVITPDNSGQIQFQLNGVNVPSPSVAPAFSAYQSVAQSISVSTFTKVMFQVKEFDTNNNFDNVTNYRFQPTVAGYYQVSSAITYSSSATSSWIISIFKNGNEFKRGITEGTVSNPSITVGALIYLNGTTDYIELYTYQTSGGSVNLFGSQVLTYFQAFLARTA